MTDAVRKDAAAIPCWKFTIALQIVDFSAIAGSLAACALFHHRSAEIATAAYAVTTIVTAVLTWLTFSWLGLYAMPRQPNFRVTLRRIAHGWTVIIGALSFIALFSRGFIGFSRVWMILWFVSGFVCLVAGRYGMDRLQRHYIKAGRLTHSIVLVGGTNLARLIVERLHNNPYGVHILGYFDDRNRDGTGEQIIGLDKLGSVADLVEFVSETQIDTVIVALPLNATRRLAEVIKKLRQQPINIRLAADFFAFETILSKGREWDEIPGIPLFPIANRPIEGWNPIVKEIFDKIAAALALFVFAPIMLCVAFGIKLTSEGPILFKQPRKGYRGRNFIIYKFRTMHQAASNTAGDQLTTANDPRIYPFGSFLRRTSIDELPQLFNVLRGDMSIVGPRPHALNAKAEDRLYNEIVDEYAARHRVKPGITGWAQVNGWRGPTEKMEQLEKRVEYDLYYIENWTISFDMMILVLTVFRGFTGKNAY